MRLDWEPLVWRLHPVRSPNPANLSGELGLPSEVANMFNCRVAEYYVETLVGEGQSATVRDGVLTEPVKAQVWIKVAQSQPATYAA